LLGAAVALPIAARLRAIYLLGLRTKRRRARF
jgi:hypothetical protein